MEFVWCTYIPLIYTTIVFHGHVCNTSSVLEPYREENLHKTTLSILVWHGIGTKYSTNFFFFPFFYLLIIAFSNLELSFYQ